MPAPSTLFGGAPTGGGNGGNTGNTGNNSDDTSEIYILGMGQSNLVTGLGVDGELTVLSNPRVSVWNADTQTLPEYAINTPIVAGVDLDDVEPNVMNSVISFAHRVALENPGRNVRVLIAGKRGTGIAEGWTGLGDQSPQYAAMKREALRFFGAAPGEKNHFDYVIWDQGETHEDASQAQHNDALDLLDAQLRAESFVIVDDDDPFANTRFIMPVIPMNIAESDGVRAAQIAYNSLGDRLHWSVVDTTGLRLATADNLHWDNQSQFERGFDRYFNAVRGTNFRARPATIQESTNVAGRRPVFSTLADVRATGMRIGGVNVPAAVFSKFDADYQIDGAALRQFFAIQIADNADLSNLSGPIDIFAHPQLQQLGVFAGARIGPTTSGFFAFRGPQPGRVLFTPVGVTNLLRMQLEYDGDTSMLVGGDGSEAPSASIAPAFFVFGTDRVNLGDASFNDFVVGVNEFDAFHIPSPGNNPVNGIPVNQTIYPSYVVQGGETFNRVWQFHPTLADAQAKTNAFDIPEAGRVSALLTKGAPGASNTGGPSIVNQTPRTVNAQQSSTMGPLQPRSNILLTIESYMTEDAYNLLSA